MEQFKIEQNKWIRFPIKLVDKILNETLDGNVPIDQMEDGWYDIKLDSIKGLRPFYEEDFSVSGTLLFLTTGDNVAVELKPSTVRKLLGYEPQILKSEFNETTSD